MNKTKIEWCDYTINPVKGLCPTACKDNQGKEYCYARRMYKRFKWNPEIRFYSRWYSELPFIKPSKIFIGSTIELFGDWIPDEWLGQIFRLCSEMSQHTFIFLTKQPQALIKWNPFPDNCQVGVTATNQEQSDNALQYLLNIKAKVKFISYEPLLGAIHFYPGAFLNGKPYIHLIIIGQQTPIKKVTMPKVEWIQEIVEAADKAGIPIFEKYNLVGLLPIEEPFYKQMEDGWSIRQEFPR